MESSIYKVKTAVFEGPLDLLLSLIEKRKLFINDISLAEVTDDYIAYINELNETKGIKMADIADFIVVAATLILIKSKSLLPGIELSDEEKESIEELEIRLQTYKAIKEVGREIKELYGKEVIFKREESEDFEIVFAPGETLSIKTLHGIIQDMIGRMPKKEKRPEAVVKKVISLEEMIEKLTERIGNATSVSFEEFKKTSSHKELKEQKIHAIVSFLALLELVKQGLIDVIQDREFEDIEIAKAPSA